MALTSSKLSLCHFVELTECEDCLMGFEPRTKPHHHYCSHCGAEAKEWFNPPAEHFSKLELALRRYQDGACTYEELEYQGQELLNRYRHQFISALRGRFDDHKVDAWYYDAPRRQWRSRDDTEVIDKVNEYE